MSISAAIRAASRAAARASGTKVSIRRGEVQIDDVPCGLGTTNFEAQNYDGSIVTTRSQDFLILAELYDFGDGPVEPARGDIYVFEQADGEHEYELLDLTGQHCWRWSDQYQQRLRLHTKEITKPT